MIEFQLKIVDPHKNLKIFLSGRVKSELACKIPCIFIRFGHFNQKIVSMFLNSGWRLFDSTWINNGQFFITRGVHRWITVLVLLWTPLAVLANIVSLTGAKLLPDIYWNTSNNLFLTIYAAQKINVNIRDQVNIVCPIYKRNIDPSRIEFSELYSVSEYGYRNCLLTSDAKIVGVCKTPFRKSVITVVFREYTPTPGGLEFIPGNNYYFISTSNGSKHGMSNKSGGLCRWNMMKLQFEVHPYRNVSAREEVLQQSSIEPYKQRRGFSDRNNQGQYDSHTLGSNFIITQRRNRTIDVDHRMASNLSGFDQKKNTGATIVNENTSRFSNDKRLSTFDDVSASNFQFNKLNNRLSIFDRKSLNNTIILKSETTTVLWYEIHTRPYDSKLNSFDAYETAYAASYGSNVEISSSSSLPPSSSSSSSSWSFLANFHRWTYLNVVLFKFLYFTSFFLIFINDFNR